MNVTGAMGDAIIVENDNNYETVTYQPLKSLKDVSKEEVLNRIKEAGVVDMGGAGFPTHT